jgi:hypothetical protein
VVATNCRTRWPRRSSNAQHLGGQPIALALGLAAAAVLSLALTVLGLVRRRRGEFALLKALGMT